MKSAELEAQLKGNTRVAIPTELEQWLKRWKRLYIAGAFAEGISRETFPTTNPATHEELSEICLAKKDDVNRAVEFGRMIFERGDWSHKPLRERAAVLKEIANLILEHRATLAILETLDTGKPIRESFEGDILRAASNFSFFAELALEDKDEIFDQPGAKHVVKREPLGVVALITPWNLPLYLESWKLAPSLLMGNSVIMKPSELTPLTAAYLSELIDRSSLPKGVFQLVQGFGENSTGEFLVSHPGVDAISFTGETGTGRAIMKNAAAGPTRVSFELGGKGASIIFADADFETALNETLRAGYRNQGEICLASPRVFVEQSRYDEFVEKFTAKANQIKVGDPLIPTTQMGALISEEHWEKVNGYVRKIEAPGKILCGGERPVEPAKGNFLRPTVVVGIDEKHPVSREEIFGPVVAIYPFENEEEAIRKVNDTPYGLSASVWTKDREKAMRVSHRLRVGLAWINSWFVRDLRVPFGGQKRSGVGREGGKHSLEFFSDYKSICIKE